MPALGVYLRGIPNTEEAMEQFLSIVFFDLHLRSARRRLPLDEVERNPKPRDPEARERLISRIAPGLFFRP